MKRVTATHAKVVSTATSTPNMVAFSTTAIDHAAAETQYTGDVGGRFILFFVAGFKFWISESEDHFKPELAQLLYPLFTHLYIRFIIHLMTMMVLNHNDDHDD